MLKKITGLVLSGVMLMSGVQADGVAQVTNVSVTNIEQHKATVVWDEVDGADFYRVKLMDEKDSKIKAKNVTDPTKTFKKLKSNTNYAVKVRAVVDGVKGEWSNVAQFTTAATTDVVIDDLAFSPSTVTINVGDSVTWANNDSMDHTVTSDTSAFDSGDINPGQTFQLDFQTAGTYKYHCSYHSDMMGTIVVQEVQ